MKSNEQTMTMNHCDKCRYISRLIALGLGVRCTHPNNQLYKLAKDRQNMPVIITRVPFPCQLKETKQEVKND